MPERLFPTLERTDLIVHTYDAGLPQVLMGTEATPETGSSIELDEGTTITFQGSFVRRGEPGSDAHLFAVGVDDPEAVEPIEEWLTESLRDDPFAKVETAQGFADVRTGDLDIVSQGPLAAD